MRALACTSRQGLFSCHALMLPTRAHRLPPTSPVLPNRAGRAHRPAARSARHGGQGAGLPGAGDGRGALWWVALAPPFLAFDVDIPFSWGCGETFEAPRVPTAPARQPFSPCIHGQNSIMSLAPPCLQQLHALPVRLKETRLLFAHLLKLPPGARAGDVLPWLLERLRSEASAVERSGAAQVRTAGGSSSPRSEAVQWLLIWPGGAGHTHVAHAHAERCFVWCRCQREHRCRRCSSAYRVAPPMVAPSTPPSLAWSGSCAGAGRGAGGAERCRVASGRHSHGWVQSQLIGPGWPCLPAARTPKALPVHWEWREAPCRVTNSAPQDLAPGAHLPPLLLPHPAHTGPTLAR